MFLLFWLFSWAMAADIKPAPPKPAPPPVVLELPAKPDPKEVKPQSPPPKEKGDLEDVLKNFEILEDYVKITPLYQGTRKSNECLYEYQGFCFANKDALESHLIRKVQKKLQKPDLKKEVKAFIQGDNEDVTVPVIFFDGKAFKTQDDFLLFLVVILDEKRSKLKDSSEARPEQKTIPKPEEQPMLPGPRPAQAPVQPARNDPKVTWPSEFKEIRDKKIGTYYSKEHTMLVLAEYASLTNRGPEKYVHLSHQSSSYVEDGHIKVCFTNHELFKLIPPDAVGRYLAAVENRFKDASDTQWLPATIDTTVVPQSVTGDKDTICYKLAKIIPRPLDSHDYSASLAKAEKLFGEFKGINDLPADQLQALKSLWTPNSLGASVEKVEHFWRDKVEYLLNDFQIYDEYFAKNPNANLLEAALNLKRGRCVPKNFGLATSLYQLGTKDYPVRLLKVMVIPGSEKEETQELNAKHMHLAVQILMPASGGGFEWRTVEASVAPEDEAKKKEREIQEQKKHEESQKLSADIEKVVREQLGLKTSLKFGMMLKKLRNIDSKTTVHRLDEGHRYTTQSSVRKPEYATMTAMTSTAIENPEVERGQALIEETEKGLSIELKGEKQLVPGMKLIDLFAGKPEHLALFMGIDPIKNKMELSRAFKSLGGRKFQDTRTLIIHMPSGKQVRVTQVFILDFASPSVLLSLSHWVDDSLCYEMKVE